MDIIATKNPSKIENFWGTENLWFSRVSAPSWLWIFRLRERFKKT